MEDLTPVVRFGKWWCKREDLACWTDIKMPSGSKVRQYNAMYEKSGRVPALVGCSAYSAQQIYVAAAAAIRGTQGIVYVPHRAKWTEATEYAARLGAEMNWVKPGYPSVYRARARERAKELGQFVRWDGAGAVWDAAVQTGNLPKGVRRVIVPTGSGLTAAGIMVGLAGGRIKPLPIVVAVAVSRLSNRDKIIETACKTVRRETLPHLEYVYLGTPYERHAVAKLPDGTPLDPYYAAKALPLVKPGDCFWPPGLRPVAAMPEECKEAFKGWHGASPD